MLLLIPLELLCDSGDKWVGWIWIGEERRKGEYNFVQGESGRPCGFQDLQVSYGSYIRPKQQLTSRPIDQQCRQS